MLRREHSVSGYLRAPRRAASTRAFGLAVLLGAVAALTAPVCAQQPAGPKLPPGVPLELQDFIRQALVANNADAATRDKIGVKWRGVPRIKGHANVIYRGTIDEGGLVPSEVASRQEEVTVRFEMERDDSHGTDNLFWRAKTVDLSGGSSGQSTFVWADYDTQTTESSRFRGPPEHTEEMTLSFDTQEGRWQLVTPGFTRDRYTVLRNRSGQEYRGRWVGVNESETLSDNRVQSFVFDGTIPEEPGVVTAAGTVDGNAGGKPTRPHQKTGRIVFWPEFDDYMLEVTIDDYAKWRPLGLIGAAEKPGSQLTAKAMVVPKGSSSPAQVKAIRFELLDVSREPGVCMNWPLGATDRNTDLKLASDAMTPGDLGADDQKLEVTRPSIDPQLRPYALGRIESFDFGARATLRVTCELLDGRELVGELKGDSGETAQDLIRLPKMDGPGWIAEIWKEENDAAALADTDDSEKVDGQFYDGDGFTLYEEYRGWVVDGRRVEGDPKRKDFFVLNQRGADARGGIALFERLSQLRVHSRLRPSEMSEEARLMNGNRREAPHLVKQHGIVILEGGGFPGALTVPVDGAPRGTAFRPKNVRWIILEHSEAGRGLGAFSVKKGLEANLDQRDAELAWDRAIAHELLHCVGVDHHGEGLMTRYPLYLQGATHPLNSTGRPRLVHEGPAPTWEWYERGSSKFGAAEFSADRGPTVTVVWEDTKTPVYADVLAAYEAWLPKARMLYDGDYLATITTQLAYTRKSGAFWTELLAHDFAATVIDLPRLAVGNDNATDSGNELCVMRYYFANGYRKKGEDHSYVMIRPGANKAGRDICRSPEGTGGNGPPFRRFGDAASGRGNCFGQICPNDNVPPRR